MSAENNPPGRVVLLVEDERGLLEITALRLQELGCEVIKAEEPNEALELFKTHRERIDFVFTDLRMSGMGGTGLIERVFEIDPTMRVVAASALLDELDAVRHQWGERVRLMFKPYNTEELRVLLALQDLDKPIGGN